MRKPGFTLLELLVVIVILGILITLGSKGVRSARISAKKAQAMVEMKSIETAIKAYQNKYGRLPAEVSQPFDVDLSQDKTDLLSQSVISILTVADDMDAAKNPAEMVFLDPQGSGSDGAFMDPWGYQYRIALDTDYDGRVRVAGEEVRRSAAILSVGLYLLKGEGHTNDLIKSWF